MPTTVSPESSVISEKYSWPYVLIPMFTQQDYLLMKNIYARRSELTNIQSLTQTLINRTLSRTNTEEKSVINGNNILAVLA